MLNRVDGRDRGFTLVELIVSITILGILSAAVLLAITTMLRASTEGRARVGEAADLQHAGSVFADDVAGALTVAVGGTARCGTEAPLVELRGERFNPTSLAPITTVVSYVTRTATVDGTPARQLVRLECEAAGATPAYPLAVAEERILARELSASPASPPGASCRTSGGAGIGCDDAAAVDVLLSLTGRSGESSTQLIGHRRTT